MPTNTGRDQGDSVGGLKKTNRPLPHLAGRQNPSVQTNQQGQSGGQLDPKRRAVRSQVAKDSMSKKQEGE